MGQFKQGLDYFPFSIGLLKDRKLRRPKLKYGYVVNDIYLSLLELIYGDKGYYIRYDEKTKEDVIWDILENLQGKYCPDAETVEQVIGDLVACELFSGDHFKSEILTSKRIQQIYYSATVERKAVDINFDIWLLSEEEMRKLSSKSVILVNFLNRSNENPNRSIESSNRSNETESKVNKSKEKYSNHHLLTPSSYPNNDKIEEEIDEEDDNNNNYEMNTSKDKLNYFYELVIEAIESYVDCCYHTALKDIAQYCKGVAYIKINGSSVESWEYLQELYCACRRVEDDIEFFTNIFAKVSSQGNITNQRQYLMTAIYNASKFAGLGF